MMSNDMAGLWNRRIDDVHSLTRHRKAKRNKRGRRSKHSTSNASATTRASRTALDTMTLRTIRKIPSMSTFTWQHISEEIETQMSKIELEETSTNEKAKVKELYHIADNPDTISEQGKTKTHKIRRLDIKNKSRKTYKKRPQGNTQRDENHEYPDHSKPRLRSSRRKVKHEEIIATNSSLIKGDAIGVSVSRDEANNIARNVNYPNGMTPFQKEISNNTITRDLSWPSSYTSSECAQKVVTGSITIDTLKTSQTSTKRMKKTTNHVKFKVRLPPINVGRGEYPARHSERKTSPQTEYRQPYTLPKLVLPPGNMKMKMITIRDTKDSLELTESKRVEKEVRGIARLRDSDSEELKYKRSKSEVFRRFREYHSKRAHVTVY